MWALPVSEYVDGYSVLLWSQTAVETHKRPPDQQCTGALLESLALSATRVVGLSHENVGKIPSHSHRGLEWMLVRILSSNRGRKEGTGKDSGNWHLWMLILRGRNW